MLTTIQRTQKRCGFIPVAISFYLLCATPLDASPCEGMPNPDRAICRSNRASACFNYAEDVLQTFGYKAAGISKWRVLNDRHMFVIHSERDADIISGIVENVYASNLTKFTGDEMKVLVEMCNAGLQLPY